MTARFSPTEGWTGAPTREDIEREFGAAKSPCPHCTLHGLRTTLQRVATARGEVDRCWQCGGEYSEGILVWPRPSAPFLLSDLEQARATNFCSRHEARCKTSAFTLHFTRTGLGTTFEVKCKKCRKKLDVTDYTNW